MSDWIFLDHSRACPSKRLIDQFAKSSTDHWMMGPTQKAREKMCEILGFEEEDICLKTTLAESHIHLLFSHYIDSIRETGRTHILAPANEQEGILAGIKRLEKFEVQGKILAVNEKGQLLPSTLQEAVRARSSLLSISWAHPKTGVLQPISELIQICRENDIQVHLDLSAALGKVYFQLSDFDADFATFDGGILGMPLSIGVIVSKKKLWNTQVLPFSYYSNLATAVELAYSNIETYAMEIAPIRDDLEKRLEELGASLPYQGEDRLPNVAVAEFPGIHSQQLLHALKQEGIIGGAINPFAISFTLGTQTKPEEMDRLLAALAPIVDTLQKKPRLFTEEDAKAKNMRLCKARMGEKEKGRELTLSLLVDEEDGVIADATFVAFGPPSFQNAAEVTCNELLRKNYMQARRMTVDLIEKKMSFSAEDSELNLVIDAIDSATEKCMDIPIEDIYVAPPTMEGGERSVYPGWETLSNEQKKKVIAEVVERDVRPYVELDAGGVEVVKVEDNRVTIAYSGNCTSCFSATGATLDAIGGILRHKIYPDLMVIPDASVLQS